MRKLHLTKEINPEIIKEKMRSATNVSDYKRWQIIYNVRVYSVDAEYLSDITGFSKANVYTIVQRFNNSKDPDVTTKPRGGRRREIMSVEQERELMNSLESKALKGEILSGKDIRKIVEQKVNKPVSDDYIWIYLSEMVGQNIPPGHIILIETSRSRRSLKKNSRTIWIPRTLILNQP